VAIPIGDYEMTTLLLKKRFYQRIIPLAITSIVILIGIVQYFGVKNQPMTILNSSANEWATIIAVIALLYGQFSLLLWRSRRLVLRKATKRQLFDDAVFIGTFLIVTMLAIILPGNESNPTFLKILETLTLTEIGIISLRGIYQVITVFKIFPQFSSLESWVFFTTWFIASMRELSVVATIFPQINWIGNWLWTVPTKAITQTFIAAAGIASIVLGVRALLGREPGLIEMETQ
jgi:hypothetical protein